MSKLLFYIMLLGVLFIGSVLAWFIFMIVYAKTHGLTLKQLWLMFDQVDNEELKSYNDSEEE